MELAVGPRHAPLVGTLRRASRRRSHSCTRRRKASMARAALRSSLSRNSMPVAYSPSSGRSTPCSSLHTTQQNNNTPAEHREPLLPASTQPLMATVLSYSYFSYLTIYLVIFFYNFFTPYFSYRHQ